jgi:type VI secretion system secreted protein VgrG
MNYTQENRLVGIKTPLGDDALLLQRFKGTEGISRLFRFEAELLSENPSIAFNDIVGKNVSLRLRLADEEQRFISGVVSRFAQGGADRRFHHYHMEIVPWPWFLTRASDCRIFQNVNVPDILKKVFEHRRLSDYKLTLTGDYPALEYCVQYRETDFDFISRLMEQTGIFYYFEHEEDKHTMVLADSPSTHQPCPHQSTVRYNLVTGGRDEDDVITHWQTLQELRTGEYALTDYNFETPSTDLGVSEPTVVGGGNSKFDMYDYPGLYPNKSQGKDCGKLRMQEQEVQHRMAKGSSVCRPFASGYKFDLEDHYRGDINSSYVLTEVEHEASVGESYTSGDDPEGESYSNNFLCIPATVPFRPQRLTRKPFVQGPQPAIVTGPSGEEIYVDKYGRVKVQFYWDRVGQKNENSSCWVRTSQPWAGKDWGGMWIPRIGQEVLVDFLEGDPDRPIITGRVYNADQTPPYTLPDHQTVSTFKSNSSKGGGGYNELRFEDKSDSEQVYLQAQKDLDVRVKHDSREFVGNDRSLIVKNDQKENVSGNLHIQVGGNRAEKIAQNMSLQVGEQLNEKSGIKFAHDAGEEIHLKAGMNIVIESGLEITIKAGANFINLGPAGIAIQGTMVMINSGGAAGAGSGSNPESPQDPDEADSGTNFGKS